MNVVARVSLLAFTVLAMNVAAQDHHGHDHGDQDSIRTVTKDRIQIEAEQARISQAPVRTEVVSSRELRRAACCSLAESFERSPSVEVSFSDAVSGVRQIQMLGLSGLYTQVMVEAVPLIRSLEMPYGFDHIPGPFMDNISISKGASSVAAGYEGQTGQINVALHEPLTARPWFFNLYGSSMNRFEFNGYGTQAITDELSTMTMLHAGIQQGDIDNNHDNFQDSPEIQRINLIHRWQFNNDETEGQFFIRGLADTYTSGQLAPAGGLPRYAIETNVRRVDGFAKFGFIDLFDGYDESGLAFTLNGSTHRQESVFGPRNLESTQNTFNFRTLFVLGFSRELKINAGLSYLYDNVTELLTDTTATRNFRYDNSRTEHVPGAYAEATYQPVRALTFVGGLRADAHNLYGTQVTPRFHAKWQVATLTTLRANIGTGWRVPTVVTENLSAYINSRTLHLDTAFRPEKSWNAGFSVTHAMEVFGRPVTLDGEVFYTRFNNRVVVDFDRDVHELWVTNLSGSSYSQHVMLQALISPVQRFDVLVAWRGVNVQVPTGGTQQMAPMVSRNRWLFTATWDSPENDWTLDASGNYNGSGRLPTTAGNPAAYQRSTEYPGFWRINTQVTWRGLPGFELYAGAENLTNFIQDDPVIAADAPYSEFFDASLAWGPTSPRMGYVGLRWTP